MEIEAIIDLIPAAAHAGRVGDGKILTDDVWEVVRIRTGERSTRIE